MVVLCSAQFIPEFRCVYNGQLSVKCMGSNYHTIQCYYNVVFTVGGRQLESLEDARTVRAQVVFVCLYNM